ncbi:MAG: DivIVA domain-containing protein [Clostridia bacterium]
MLAPHELKNKTFNRAVRGYNPSEVDDYVEFLIEKYTELYRENNELERKLKIVVTNLDEIRDEEEAIRSTLLKSQKLGEKIVREANEKADAITDSIKDRCASIINDFRDQFVAEKQNMWSLRTIILDFKKKIFDIYRQQIEEIQGISVNELEDIVLPDEKEIITHIFTDVKDAVKSQIETESKVKADENLNIENANSEQSAEVSESSNGNNDDELMLKSMPQIDLPNDTNNDGSDSDEDFIDKLEKQE